MKGVVEAAIWIEARRANVETRRELVLLILAIIGTGGQATGWRLSLARRGCLALVHGRREARRVAVHKAGWWAPLRSCWHRLRLEVVGSPSAQDRWVLEVVFAPGLVRPTRQRRPRGPEKPIERPRRQRHRLDLLLACVASRRAPLLVKVDLDAGQESLERGLLLDSLVIAVVGKLKAGAASR